MECLPSKEYNRILDELYKRGNIEEILAFVRNYSEIIYEPLSKDHIEANRKSMAYRECLRQWLINQ